MLFVSGSYIRIYLFMILFCFFNDSPTTDIYTYGHTLSLHDALPVLAVHRDVRGRHVRLLAPRLGDQHQLGGGGIAAGAADRLEHRVERGGVARDRRDHRLDGFRMRDGGEARQHYLVARHPVADAAARVDLAMLRETPERRGQPPL